MKKPAIKITEKDLRFKTHLEILKMRFGSLVTLMFKVYDWDIEKCRGILVSKWMNTFTHILGI